MTILQITLLALFYAICLGSAPALASSFMIGQIIRFPVVIGPIVGLILGDPMTGLLMGATINLIYLGNLSVGGQVPSDQTLAGFMGVALGIVSGLDTEAAVALAVPFGVIGPMFSTLIRTVYVAVLHRVQSCLAKRDLKAMYGWFYSTIVIRAVLFFAIIFVALFAGSEVTVRVVGLLPAWALTGLNTIGKVLPALGIALGIKVVCKRKEELAYFITALLAVKYLGVPTIFCTALAAMLAWYKVAAAYRSEKEAHPELFAARPEEAEAKAGKGLLTMKDINTYAWLHINFSQSLFNFEDYNGTGKAMILGYILKKLYPNDPEKQARRIEKHMNYFNCNPRMEGLIFGPVAAMEEEIAMGNEVSDESIMAIKSGLMGPLAGIGDSILSGVLAPVFCAIGITYAQSGSYVGPVIVVVLQLVMTLALVFGLFSVGYKGGKVLLEKLFATNLMQFLSQGGAIVALASFGALAASAVTVKFGITFQDGAASIQSILDGLLLGLLPIVLCLTAYNRLEKGTKTLKLLLILMVGAFVLGALGILA